MKTASDTLSDIAQIQSAVDNSDMDAIVIVSPENLRYAADVHFTSQLKIRDRLTLIVWPKGGEPVMVVCLVWEALVRRNSWIKDLRTYREFEVSPIQMVVDVLKELRLSKGRIGYEGEYLAGRYCDELRGSLPDCQFSECDDLLARVRMIKTPKEIELLSNAYRGTASALEDTFKSAKVGETERALSRRLSNNILKSGANSVASMVMGAGENTGLHVEASDYVIKQGDIMKSDCGGLYQGYFSNIGRTAKLGKLNDEDQSIWTRLREIQHELVNMLRPGNTGGELFHACEKLHSERKLPFSFGHNGHSVGLMIHERPIIGPHETIPYEAGMVSTVETRVRWPGRIGYHMEDLFLITDKDPLLLSNAFDNEHILTV